MQVIDEKEFRNQRKPAYDLINLDDMTEGAKDYYPSRYIALCYAHRYQRACVNCGLSSENVYVVSGTNE